LFLFCVVVWVFRVTTALLVFWFVFLCGFAVWFGFGSDFVVGGSLVYMGVCCGSVFLVVDACWVTSLFTSWLRRGWGCIWVVGSLLLSGFEASPRILFWRGTGCSGLDCPVSHQTLVGGVQRYCANFRLNQCAIAASPGC